MRSSEVRPSDTTAPPQLRQATKKRREQGHHRKEGGGADVKEEARVWTPGHGGWLGQSGVAGLWGRAQPLEPARPMTRRYEIRPRRQDAARVHSY